MGVGLHSKWGGQRVVLLSMKKRDGTKTFNFKLFWQHRKNRNTIHF